MGHRLGGTQHETLQQHLPVAHLRMGLQLLRERAEVDRVEPRRRPIRPPVGERLHDAEHAGLVRRAPEIAKDMVEGDAALLNQPRGHGRNRSRRRRAQPPVPRRRAGAPPDRPGVQGRSRPRRWKTLRRPSPPARRSTPVERGNRRRPRSRSTSREESEEDVRSPTLRARTAKRLPFTRSPKISAPA